MRIPTQLRELLRDSRGSANLREEVMSLPVQVKVVSIAASLAVLVAVLVVTVTMSAHANGRYNVSSLQFEKDVQGSSIVRGLGGDAVAILTSAEAERCTVKVWQVDGNDGNRQLETRPTTVDDVCSETTPVGPFAAGSGEIEVANLRSAEFAFENVGGRIITFDHGGRPTLTSGSQPTTVGEADWNDLRPYRVTLDLTSAAERVGKFAKSRQYVGTTRVTNVPQADADLHYVPPVTPVVAPSALTITAVSRSSTSGTVYSGVREGTTVTVTGGVCESGSTKLTITYTPAAPTGLSPVSTAAVAPLTGAAYSVELAGVQNGSDGTILAVASCGKNSMTVQDQRDYHQPVPAPQLAVKQGATAEQYVLTWTAVSSLPATYRPEWATSFGTDNDMASTTALTASMAFTTGSTYGASITFWINASINQDLSKSMGVSISTAWPATPAGANMTYTRTGYSGNFVSGTVKWNFTGTCPAGTTIQASQLEDRTGQSNGTASNTVNYQGPFQNNLTQVNWSPSNATQGYLYGMGLQTRCASPNGFYSPVAQVQSRDWITPFATPAQSSWQAFNFRDYVRGTAWTYNTCAAGNCAKSIQVDWGTACPVGTWVGWSNWYSRSWTGGIFTHPYGYQDNWGLPSGVNSAIVTYYGAQYYCSSPWANSPYSPASGGVNVTVLR